MLSEANFPVTDAIRLLGDVGVEAGYLSPTPTGLDKSIMDAHAPFRAYLRDKGLHDYASQGQGQEHKLTVSARIVGVTGTIGTTASIYRPKTKTGDPRIWISGLRPYVTPHDLIAVVVQNRELLVFNISNHEIRRALADPLSLVRSVVESCVDRLSPTALELLGKLRDISKLGFVPTERQGDTGVGFTLERLLGIQANSSRRPDYKGIELKASRSRERMVSLFSQVPDWSTSHLSALGVVEKYGYRRDGGPRQLYCTVSSRLNSQRLVLSLDERASLVRARHVRVAGGHDEVLCWPLQALTDALASKHRETMWVTAETRGSGASEAFHYKSVERTSRPLVEHLGFLVDSGVVSVDLTLKEREASDRPMTVNDHGYLFRMRTDDKPLAFGGYQRVAFDT
jgi:hypothetical protein